MKILNKDLATYIIDIAKAEGLPLQLSKLIACQSAFETDNWTSDNFKKNANGFGYKFVSGGKWQLQTPGIQSTESDHYAAYSVFENSINEICDWIKRRQKEGKFPVDLTTIQTPQQYAYLLKDCGYYGSKKEDYAAGIEMYFKQLEV